MLSVVLAQHDGRYDDLPNGIWWRAFVAVADFAVARAAYRAACRRWPEAKITLRQGARVLERNWSTSETAN